MTGERSSISWDRKGTKIDDSNAKYEVRIIKQEDEYVSELLVKYEDDLDFTSYGCKAENEAGTDYLEINLEKGITRNLQIIYQDVFYLQTLRLV